VRKNKMSQKDSVILDGPFFINRDLSKIKKELRIKKNYSEQRY